MAINHYTNDRFVDFSSGAMSRVNECSFSDGKKNIIINQVVVYMLTDSNNQPFCDKETGLPITFDSLVAVKIFITNFGLNLFAVNIRKSIHLVYVDANK